MKTSLLSLLRPALSMRLPRQLGFLLLLSVAFGCGALSLFGQATEGNLVGAVSDASGSAVPNADVKVKNVGTNIETAAKTNVNGEYRFNNLPIGAYDLTVSATGFAAATEINVVIDLNKTATINVSLQVGSVSQTVEVSEAAVTIDTTTAQVQNTFDSRQTQDLPTATVGLGVLNLSLLGSGVASSGGVGAGTGPSVGGQRPRNNNFTIEGVDNNNKSVTGPLVYIPNDAVSEFTLLQNQFSPEYGHSSGGQFNTVIKSGTNAFHGTMYDYLQNRNLDAVDQSLANQGIYKNPRFDSNRLGATIGGPILKNKLFFFGSFEYNPVGQSSVPAAGVEAPTPAGYQILSGIPGLSKTNLGILQKYGQSPTQNGTDSISVTNTASGQQVSVPIGIIPIVAPNYTNNYAALGSVDYTISDKDQLRGRVIYNKSAGIDTAATLPVFYLPAPTTYYLGTLTEYHNFTPNLTNEFRLGYNRFNNSTPSGNFKYPGLDQFPNIVLYDMNLQIGPDPNAPQFTIQNTYQITDNVNWVKGSHTLTIGFDGHKAISPQSFTQRARGDYDYNSTDLFLRDLTPDNLAERSLGNVIYYGDQVALYPYINDSWRIRPNFTLNLGLRYEFTSVPYSERLQSLNAISNTPGVLDFNTPQPQYHNFAPRVGIAYSPGKSGNTSIRAGFGMSYDVLYDNIGILALPPQLSSTVDSNINVQSPNYLANGGIPPNAASGSLDRAGAIANTSNYVPNQKLPYSIQWNFDVQHVFANDYTFEARYLGTRGVHLNVQTRINVLDKVDNQNYLPTYLTAPSQAQLDSLTTTLSGLKARPGIVPQFLNAGFTNNIVEFSPLGNSSYNGLALQLNRRFSHGLQFIGAYTWSHLVDDSTADFFTTRLTPRRQEDFQNLRIDRGTSALDRRNRLTATILYDLPYFKNSNWFMKNLVGNWEFAPIYTFESPEYATVQSATDSNLNGDSAGDRTIINKNGVPNTGSGVTALKNSAGATVAYLAKNPNAEYITAGKGALSNGGRNTIATRRIDNVDLSAVKRFSLTERFSFQLQAQLLNAFNHPQFTPGSLNQINSIGQAGGAVLNYMNPASPSFNNPEVTFASNARVIQVGAKIIF